MSGKGLMLPSMTQDDDDDPLRCPEVVLTTQSSQTKVQHTNNPSRQSREDDLKRLAALASENGLSSNNQGSHPKVSTCTACQSEGLDNHSFNTEHLLLVHRVFYHGEGYCTSCKTFLDPGEDVDQHFRHCRCSYCRILLFISFSGNTVKPRFKRKIGQPDLKKYGPLWKME